MSSIERPYIKALDSLRVLAISAVVLVHTTTRTIEAAKYNILEFPWTILFNQLGRFSVPLFFMVSGFALELNYDFHANYFSYLKKRAVRVLIPFIFWSLIYYSLVYTNNHDNILTALLTGNASYQLYFIPTLILFYLFFPILHKIYKYLSHPVSVILLSGFEVWLLYKDYFIKEFKYPDPIHIAILAYIFFIYGMIAAKNNEKIIEFVRKLKTIIIPAAIISGLYVFWEGFSGYLLTKNYLTFYSSWRPSTFIYSVLFALITFFVFETHPLFDKSKLQFEFAKKLSNLSFFVFFVHVIVLEMFWKSFGHSLFNIFSSNPIGRFLFDPVFFTAVIFISFFTAFIIRKIPYLKKITG